MTKGKDRNIRESIEDIYSSITERTKDFYRKNKAKLATGAMLLPALLGGCQATQTSYMEDPNESSWIVREGGRTANVYDVKFPRKRSEAGKKLGDNIKRLPTHILYTAERIPAFFGVEPFEWAGFYNEEDEDSWRHMPNHSLYELDEFEGPGTVAVYPVRRTGDLLTGVGGIIGDVKGSLDQIINIGILQPISTETFEWAGSFDNENIDDYTKSKDGIKYFLDGTTDIFKGPVKLALSSFGSGIPDSFSDSYWRVNGWAGYTTNEEKSEKLENKFSDKDGDMRKLRYMVGFIPYLEGSIDYLVWNDTWKDEPGGKRTVSYLDDSIEINLEDDEEWYGSGHLNPTRAPGVIIDGEFHPSSSFIIEGGKTTLGLGNHFGIGGEKGGGGEGGLGRGNGGSGGGVNIDPGTGGNTGG